MELEKFLEEVRKQHITDGDTIKIGLGSGMFVKRCYSGIDGDIVIVYREGPNLAREKYTIEKISQITKTR